MFGPAVLAVIALAGVVIEWWLVVPGSLSPRLLQPGPLRRFGRRLRGSVLRAGAAVLSWPRALDLAFGVRRGEPGSVPLERVWSEGRVCLWRAPSRRSEPGPAVLVVHSVVTRPWILDLSPGASLVGALGARGLDVWILDWGVPDDGDAGMDWYVDQLVRAEAVVATASRHQGVHLVGYCAGGLVLLERLRTRDRDRAATVTLIATPVDLQPGGWGLQRLLASPTFRPAWILDGRGMVPASVVRESFHLLRPEALRSIWRRWRRRRDPTYRHRYAAMGRWLWQQLPLPGRLLFDLVALARSNPYMRERGLPADIAVLAVIAERDHIVPMSSAAAIEVPMPHAEVVRIAAGHVAMVAGPATDDRLAPAIAAHVGAPARPAPTGEERRPTAGARFGS